MPGGGAGGGALKEFNALPEEEAAQRLRACCAALRWAQAVAAGRPYDDVPALLDASDAVFAHLTDRDVAEAVAGHRRVVGQDSDGVTRRALLDGNVAYEKRFGRVFLVDARGLTSGQLLHRLQVRMRNDRETERLIVREELRGITRRRLKEQFAP